jgi:hypothetical protein
VRRARCAEDERQVRVSLTEKGEALHDEARGTAPPGWRGPSATIRRARGAQGGRRRPPGAAPRRPGIGPPSGGGRGATAGVSRRRGWPSPSTSPSPGATREPYGRASGASPPARAPAPRRHARAPARPRAAPVCFEIEMCCGGRLKGDN